MDSTDNTTFDAGWYPDSSGTSVRNGLLWTIVLLPVITLISTLQFDATAYLGASLSGTAAPVDPGYVAMQFLGYILWGVTIVLAFFDRRRLVRLGMDRPFPWAWTFLSGAIYVIGRTIIVRRRVGGSLAPIWTWAVLSVLAMIIALSKAVSAISELGPSIPS
ncbi:hypothetical protein [Cryobacterium sp. CG_9.6]|uniref:hypothetical protein n=1 Tax=Cryobacterium sp. CG_9.6 TaxID=2760710 RepID=UPI0024736BEA|nr:hypothetical protein [Cryobacterium sp. CG_9.6]MDH6237658.1 hypothetical protein [Cryobacterium sp. CG_9.6]